MAHLIQHALALAAVAACAAYLARCAFKSLTGKSKCSTGCGGCGTQKTPAPTTGQTVFIPVEVLSRKK
jgi:hypothetical protein